MKFPELDFISDLKKQQQFELVISISELKKQTAALSTAQIAAGWKDRLVS